MKSKLNKQVPTLLIAFLCLTQCKSPSQEIKDAFKTVDNSLHQSNEILNNSIDTIYLSIDSNRNSNLTYALYADSIYSITKNTYHYLDSLKGVLRSKDSTGENLDLATNIFIKTETGDTLLQKLSAVYTNSYSFLIDKSKKGELDSVLVTFAEIRVNKNWKKIYFENTPTVAAMTILSKFQNDCINAATITLRDIQEHMTAQDTSFIASFDLTQMYLSMDPRPIRFQMPFNYLYHSPEDNDRKNVTKYRYLKNQQPTSNNYDEFYHLARSFWELEKLAEAERMFLTILSSNEEHYSTTYFHSSDIPGDTTVNSYGYGSFTSSYKHNAALYLTKIYIEQKQYDKAFSFLEVAVKKYEVYYTCGTGFYRQKDEFDFLYGCIYEGQRKYDHVLDLLLPECLSRNDEIIVRSIQKLYSEEQITEMLQQAENTIKCELDSFPSQSYQTTYSESKKSEKTDTLTYYSGRASINLFDKLVTIPTPNLENGERITKERFIKEFRESSFYYNLTKED